MEDDHGVWLYLKDLVDEPELAVRKPHVGTVITFRLKVVRKTGKDYGLVCFLCGLERFSNLCIIIEIFVIRETFCISYLCIRRN